MLQEALEKLLRAIGMPWSFALMVMDCVWGNQKEFSGGIKPARDCGAEEMARQLLISIQNRQNGPWKDLPENVWLDTMKCFTRFVREHEASCGTYAFDRGFWTTRQINARLFRIGELEYELLETDGNPSIALHIPSDVRLEGSLLNASVNDARSFLKTYFPKWQDAPITCESWLLSPELKQMLPSMSRILRFQQAFDLCPAGEDEKEAVLQWVFRLTPEMQKNASLRELPENTVLQRNMKRHLLSGGKVHAAQGVLVRQFTE